jgi:hypothetical protein
MQRNRRVSQPMKLLRSNVPNDFLYLERKGGTTVVKGLCERVLPPLTAYPVLERAEEYRLARVVGKELFGRGADPLKPSLCAHLNFTKRCAWHNSTDSFLFSYICV